MKDTFNVLDEGWIPVLNGSGERETLGIRELLRRAPELQAVSDASPLVEFGLYRLLTVFLMDALRPKKLSSLKKLLRAGAFDMEAIEAYIAQCETEGVSFDLLDEKRPFLQAPYDPKLDKEPVPVSKLDYTVPSGNNHTHFDHRSGDAVAFRYGEAARLLPAAQLFCNAGVQEYPSGPNGSPPYYIWICGSNLFETLVLNLGQTDQIDALDEPPVFWRCTEPVEPKKQVTKTSWLYGNLFPARRICLIPENGKVSHIYYSQGLNYISVGNWTDPAVTYQITKKGRYPLRPKKSKAVWRNLRELIDNQGCARVLHQYLELTSGKSKVKIGLYGVETVAGNDKYVTYLRHDVELPTEIGKDAEKLVTITSAIWAAEVIADGLQMSLARARLADSKGKIDWENISDDYSPDSNDRQKKIDKLKKEAKTKMGTLSRAEAQSAVQQYFDYCEPKFWELCKTILTDSADLKISFTMWCNDIMKFALTERERVINNAHMIGKRLADVERDVVFLYKCKKIVSEGT